MTKTHTAVEFDKALGTDIVDKRLDILRAIATAGSISEAARSNGVSYKAAWQALETLSNLAGTALIDTSVGGQGGGGARLTAAGQQLLNAAELLNQARRNALKKIRQARPEGADGFGIAGLTLRTSMRNHLPCTIVSIKKVAGMARVVMAMGDGTTLAARITTESLQLLGLAPHMRVLALCKAAGVMIDSVASTTVGLNVLAGTVNRLSPGRGQREVSLQIGPGLHLVGFAPGDSRLARDQSAFAHIEESAVVIGLLD